MQCQACLQDYHVCFVTSDPGEARLPVSCKACWLTMCKLCWEPRTDTAGQTVFCPGCKDETPRHMLATNEFACTVLRNIKNNAQIQPVHAEPRLLDPPRGSDVQLYGIGSRIFDHKKGTAGCIYKIQVQKLYQVYYTDQKVEELSESELQDELQHGGSIPDESSVVGLAIWKNFGNRGWFRGAVVGVRHSYLYWIRQNQTRVDYCTRGETIDIDY